MYDHYILEEGENLDTVCNLLHLDKKTIMDLNVEDKLKCQ